MNGEITLEEHPWRSQLRAGLFSAVVAATMLLPATPALPAGTLPAPTITRNTWECSSRETRVVVDTPPSTPSATVEVQVRLLTPPPQKSPFSWRTVGSSAIGGQPQRRCARFEMLPGGRYQWRVREETDGVAAPWSSPASPAPWYERPARMQWKWVRLKDIPTGLRVTWKHRGDSGGAKVQRYRVRFQARIPVGTTRPTIACVKGKFRCTILNMIEGRRTYWITITVSNGYRWSPPAKFWICAGRCS